jgi:NADPH:quinone reductase-like Zn-dependent oxidoreductase
VWGSGGELGIRRDGTHATHLVVERAHVRLKPSTVTLTEAGAIGVPFMTAYDAVGCPYFEQANEAMALKARQIFISTIKGSVPFDILSFYRGQRTYVGIDTLGLNGRDCAEILDALQPGFESGKLKPFPVLSQAIFPARPRQGGVQGRHQWLARSRRSAAATLPRIMTTCVAGGCMGTRRRQAKSILFGPCRLVDRAGS